MGGRTNRRKGHSFEREIAEQFRSVGFSKARRQLEYHEEDCNGVDLMGTEPFYIQTKKTKKYVPISTISEVKCDRAFGDIPVLIAAGNNQEPMAVLPLSDFMELAKMKKTLDE